MRNDEGTELVPAIRRARNEALEDERTARAALEKTREELRATEAKVRALVGEAVRVRNVLADVNREVATLGRTAERTYAAAVNLVVNA